MEEDMPLEKVNAALELQRLNRDLNKCNLSWCYEAPLSPDYYEDAFKLPRTERVSCQVCGPMDSSGGVQCTRQRCVRCQQTASSSFTSHLGFIDRICQRYKLGLRMPREGFRLFVDLKWTAVL